MCIISRKELAVHNRYIVLMENINAKASRLQPNYYYFPWQPLHTVSHLNCLHYNTWERHLVHGASFLKLSLFEMVHLKLPRQLSDFQRTRHGTWAENSQQFNFFEESHRFFFSSKFTIPIHQLLAILVSVHKETSRRKNNGLFTGWMFEEKHLMLERNNIHWAFKRALGQPRCWMDKTNSDF